MSAPIPRAMTDPALAEAWRTLLAQLRTQPSWLLALSGGVDSALLLAAMVQAVGPEKVLALHCAGPFTSAAETARAQALAVGQGVELVLAELDELARPEIAANPADRCYHCKRLRLGAALELARDRGLAAVAEGSQTDDAGAHRPGARAVAELGIHSPLAAAGLNKALVRALSRELGLVTADLPAAACLASRVPYGQPLDAVALGRVERAEAALARIWPQGGYRVRHHGDLARLELPPDLVAAAAALPLRGELLTAVQAAGYRWVALDLAGYLPSTPAPPQ